MKTVVEAWLRFCFWPKTQARTSMWELVRYYGAKSMIDFATILCISDGILQISILIERATLWQEFKMHNAIAIKENSEQNLHIWQNMTRFFRFWLFLTLSLAWLGFGSNIIAIYSRWEHKLLCPTKMLMCSKKFTKTQFFRGVLILLAYLACKH